MLKPLEIVLVDYLRCGQVCRSWRHTVDEAVATKGTCPPAPQFPFLMLLPPTLPNQINNPATLLDITQQDTSYTMTPPRTWKANNFESDSVFCVQGWLVFQKFCYSQNQNNYDLVVFSNPLSGQEFQLPHLPLFKLTFSDSSASEEILVVACAVLPKDTRKLHSWMQQLAFCKVTDKSWTLFPKQRHPPFDEFVIVDWKLYAMNSYTSCLTIFDLRNSAAFERLEPKSTRNRLGYYECRLARDGDEMLFVAHFMFPKSQADSWTRGFRVFKLDMCGPRPTWIEVDDLGDRVLLIDCARIQVMSAKEINLHGGNRVFFCTRNKYHVFDPLVKNDFGVFALKDKSFGSLPLCPSFRVSSRCLWFIPSPW